ncbi:predicted protein [Plenodomus lingam JN3]|uniref:Predicted protein n=1 Tax=Leptosphaeria maculans (strain JN3 / isolate v23.1.3 / race Av1-4-5-6-7-8) TaxID=985895 RepID=E4ZI11_LEPMJ|nr:predicted protein [Plenodomus lingam JN3]CBX91154.1 predicted protein [Plenodomus lingam JN3]
MVFSTQNARVKGWLSRLLLPLILTFALSLSKHRRKPTCITTRSFVGVLVSVVIPLVAP